jgi:mannose-6-phosphate isomerase-like protein (cupin superfamily)
MTRFVAVVLVAAAAMGAACRSHRTPAAIVRGHEYFAPPSADVDALMHGGPAMLRPYLDAYPLADRGTRVDLLAATNDRSMHLVQASKPIPRHVHPARTEIVYVLTGAGTCYVGDRSYPAAPGSAFKIPPNTKHSTIPDAGQTLVAIVYYEPPMTSGDDGVIVE